MTKTITITDPMQVKIGDQAYFKDCDFGFPVTFVDIDDKESPIAVHNPLSGLNFWIFLSRFDHATREVKEPEWTDPHDFNLHIYLGADGRRYIYNPIDEYDPLPWVSEGNYVHHSSENMESYCRDALPLTELELVPKKRES